MKSPHSLGLALILTACGGATPEPAPLPEPAEQPSPSPQQEHPVTTNEIATTPIEAVLRAIAGGGSAEQVEVVYDDMHALWGGETLTLQGDGTLRAVWRIPRTAPQQESTTSLSREQVRAIATLLVELHAWRQDVPEQTVPPDTSFSRLRIRVGTETSDVWELHERMERLNQIQTALRAYVPALER